MRQQFSRFLLSLTPSRENEKNCREKKNGETDSNAYAD